MDNGDSNNPETSAEGGKKGSGKKKNQKKKKSSNQRKSNSKKSSSGQDLTTKVYATMEKHKEVFFTIRLHSAQSGASLGPIGKFFRQIATFVLKFFNQSIFTRIIVKLQHLFWN